MLTSLALWVLSVARACYYQRDPPIWPDRFDLTLVPPPGQKVKTRGKYILKSRVHPTVNRWNQPLSHSRKKAIMGEVTKQRQRQRLVTLAVVVIIVGLIVGVVAFYPRSTNAVPLPSYLDKCANASAYHAHPHLSIVINSQPFTIPAIGVTGGCAKPLHTHSTDGVIHVETDEDRLYTLKDFFLIWGNAANDAKFSIFNSTQIFDFKVDAGHTLTMTVTNNSEPSLQAYTIPKNAGTTSEPCSTGSCQEINMVITYGSPAS